jgi:hypothetical protein
MYVFLEKKSLKRSVLMGICASCAGAHQGRLTWLVLFGLMNSPNWLPVEKTGGLSCAQQGGLSGSSGLIQK